MERYRPSGSTWQKRIQDHHQQHREALISAVGLIFLGKNVKSLNREIFPCRQNQTKRWFLLIKVAGPRGSQKPFSSARAMHAVSYRVGVPWQ